MRTPHAQMLRAVLSAFLPRTSWLAQHTARALSSQAETPLYFAVVGAGPAGFYTADRLLKRLGRQVRVDVIDRLPTPFGLVRSGVAPDHQSTKNVTKQFSVTAEDDRVRFFGNVHVGKDVTINALRALYTGVVLCTGAEDDRKLGIPGEDGPGVLSARRFVWWYNGHPDCADLSVDLKDVRSVAICGIGNVALDCARVLLRSPAAEPLATSDVAAHALDALARGAALQRSVHLVARRGPVQAACTPKELKELVTEPGLRVVAGQSQMAVSEEEQALMKRERVKRRLYEIISQAADASSNQKATIVPNSTPTSTSNGASRELHFQFYRQPRRILRDPTTQAVVGLEVEQTRLEPVTDTPGGPTRAVGTGVMEVIPAQLVLVSIGYRSLPIPGVSFDPSRGVIPNVAGRVLVAQSSSAFAADGTAEVDAGLYVCGWAKRGPSGIIGTNAPDAEETVSSILQDVQAARLPWPPIVAPSASTPGGAMPTPHDPGEQLLAVLERQGVQVVDWAGWQSIDRAETSAGAAAGRVRVKVTAVSDMLRVAAATDL